VQQVEGVVNQRPPGRQGIAVLEHLKRWSALVVHHHCLAIQDEGCRFDPGNAGGDPRELVREIIPAARIQPDLVVALNGLEAIPVNSYSQSDPAGRFRTSVASIGGTNFRIGMVFGSVLLKTPLALHGANPFPSGMHNASYLGQPLTGHPVHEDTSRLRHFPA